MTCVKFISFLLVSALVNLVQSRMCDLDDVECQTKGARKVFKSLMDGANGLVEPLDPIRVDKIVGEEPDSQFILTNSTLTGLKNCDVGKFKCNKQDLSFEYNLRCPKLILHTPEFQGSYESFNVEITAEEKITFVDYNIIFKGNYDLSVSEKDKKPRGIIKNYVVRTEPKGKIKYEIMKLIRGDRKKLEAEYENANKNALLMEKLIIPIIEAFMKIFVDKLNVFLKEFPLEDILSQE